MKPKIVRALVWLEMPDGKQIVREADAWGESMNDDIIETKCECGMMMFFSDEKRARENCYECGRTPARVVRDPYVMFSANVKLDAPSPEEKLKAALAS